VLPANSVNGQQSLTQMLRKATSIGQWPFAVLVTVLAVRFALVSMETGAASDEQTKQGPRKAAPSARPLIPIPAPSSSSRALLRTLLSVRHGDQRSEVYVNGEAVGNTPYVGDLSCRAGEPVKIEVLPRKGAVIERTATCRGKSIDVQVE
jgi:hypothetical protein